MKMHSSESENKHLSDAIRRLCHFVPPLESKNLSLALHEFLIKHALARLGTEPHSVSDIKNSLHQLFNLDFEDEEIKGAVQSLIKKNSLMSPSQNLYALNINEYTQLEKSLTDIREFEENTIKEWQGNMFRRYPELGIDDINALKEDLIIYLTETFERHGAECAALVYSGEEEAESFVAKLKDDIFTCLASRPPRLHKIRIIELPGFLKNASAQRKRYIAQLLDSTYIIYMLHIDKNCSALIQKQFKGYKLYLDTNFIYRLLGLDGEILQKAAKSSVKIAQELGYQLVVSTRTVEEWQFSIKRDKSLLKQTPSLLPELANIGAEYTTEEDFRTAYWRAYANTKISVYDFFVLYQRIEDLLQEFDIKISDTLCERVKQDPQLKREISKLNLATEYTKHPEVAEHDAFHRLLTIRLRGKIPPQTFIDTKTWFLTCDTTLPKYDKIARKRPDEIPFCILASQWIQIMRPLLPRTEDFDETFVNLFASPYLRTYGVLPSDITQTILSRIAQFKKHSPELAIRVLTDVHLSKELKQTKDEEKTAKLIDNAIAKVAEEFREERDQLIKQLDNIKKVLKEEKSQRAQEKEEYDDQIKESTDDLKILKEKVNTENDARLKLEKRMKWIPSYFIWILIGFFTLFTPWGKLHSWVKFLVIGIFSIGGIGAFTFPLGKSKTYRVFGIVAILCSILGFLWGLLKK